MSEPEQFQFFSRGMTNLEFNQCVKEVSNIRAVVYVNICTGEQVAVPRGSTDFLMWPLFILLFCAVAWGSWKVLSS